MDRLDYKQKYWISFIISIITVLTIVLTILNLFPLLIFGSTLWNIYGNNRNESLYHYCDLYDNFLYETFAISLECFKFTEDGSVLIELIFFFLIICTWMIFPHYFFIIMFKPLTKLKICIFILFIIVYHLAANIYLNSMLYFYGYFENATLYETITSLEIYVNGDTFINGMFIAMMGSLICGIGIYIGCIGILAIDMLPDILFYLFFLIKKLLTIVNRILYSILFGDNDHYDSSHHHHHYDNNDKENNQIDPAIIKIMKS